MTTTPTFPVRLGITWPRARTVAIALVGLAVVLVGVERTWLASVEPLWFDEAWTAQIASTPDWSTFWREIYNDIQAPLYYLSMRILAPFAGVSDFALRLPALIALTAAGAFPIASRIKGLSRQERLTWGVLIFAWWGVGQFLTARGYGLLLAISTLQCLAFIRLLETPSRGSAWRWCGLAACAILLHYLCVVVVAAQGLVYLLSQRQKALRTWPALAAFAPAGAWIAYHAPRLAVFNGMQSWHPLVDGFGAIGLTATAFNPVSPWVAAGVALIVIAALLTSRPAEEDLSRDTCLWLAAAASALGLALLLGLGAVRPILITRYLVPVVPGLLLGVVLCVRRSAQAGLLSFALMALYLGAALDPDPAITRVRQGAPYGFETGSSVLMQHGVRHVVFVWDHPATRFMGRASLSRVGGVFFERAGYPVDITPIAPLETQDTNHLVLEQATRDHSGVIWLYDRQSLTSSRRYPPRIHEIDPRWTCQRSGDAMIGAISCYR